MSLTQERLKELLDYSPVDGLFIWREGAERYGTRKVGTVAGNIHKQGYLNIRVDGKTHRAHRLAFLWMEGAFPPDQVDHINRCRTDNRWENLRHADQSLNSRNSESSKNTSGYRGVHWNKNRQKWQTRIWIDGKCRHLGYFDDPRDASAAYQMALNTLQEQ